MIDLFRISILLPFFILGGANSQVVEKCGEDISPWHGWLTNCNPDLKPEACVRQGRHCAYCFDDNDSSDDPIGCGLKGALEKNNCQNLYFTSRRTPCQTATTPTECVSAGKHCSWCADENFKKTRCNSANRLDALSCKKIETIEAPPATQTFRTGQHGFSISEGEVHVRAGQSAYLKFNITEPADYPVDLYLAIDLSYSMRNTLESVKEVTQDIFDSFNAEKMGIKVGFGQFIDKVRSPMTEMAHFKYTQHPYQTSPAQKARGLNDAEPPKLYENIAKLDSDKDAVFNKLKPIRVSGNLDGPEGALDAMVQSAACNSTIGWRDNALKLLLVITESWFHHAGDGMGKMAGLIDKNDGACHVDQNGLYRGMDTQDYPSIPQVAELLRQKNIIPIFAIRKDFEKDYSMLQKQFFKSGYVSKLKDNDKQGIINLIHDSIKKIRQSQEMNIISQNPDFEAQICSGFQAKQKKKQKPLKSMKASKLSKTAITTNRIINKNQEKPFNIFTDEVLTSVQREETIEYTTKFDAKSDACDPGKIKEGNYVIKTTRLSDKIDVKVKVVCEFPCQREPKIENSPKCEGHGDFQCGTCFCHKGWKGDTCNRRVKICERADCSGRGEYRGPDLGCECTQGATDRVFGDCCQCDESECPRKGPDNEICSANGDCLCNETKGEMYCKCHPQYGGEDCSCLMSNSTCYDPKNTIGSEGSKQMCNGRGSCYCGACQCEEGWGGPYCEKCTANCPKCSTYSQCIYLKVTKGDSSGKTTQEERQLKECEGELRMYQNLTSVEPNSLTPDNANPDMGTFLCSYYSSATNCKLYYTYKVHPARNGAAAVVEIIHEAEPRCNSKFDFMVLLWAFLAALIIGLLLLCCWKFLFHLQDTNETRIEEESVVAFVNTKTVVAKTSDPAYFAPIVRSGDNKMPYKVHWIAYEGDGSGVTREHSRLLAEKTMVATEKTMVPSGNDMEMSRMENSRLITTVTDSKLAWEHGITTFEVGDTFSEVKLSLDARPFKGRETRLTIELIKVMDYQMAKEMENDVARVSDRYYRLPVHLLRDDDPGVIGFAKPSYVFKESDAIINLPLQRTMGSDNRIIAKIATRDITALGGEDFIAFQNREYTFEDGELLKYVPIDLIPRTKYRENHERSFAVEVLTVSNGSIAKETGSCLVNVITDNELAKITFAKKIIPCLETDKTVRITLFRTNKVDGKSEIKYRTQQITALPDVDYMECEGIVTFENGDYEQTIEIELYANQQQRDEGCTARLKV